jgi:hypothetical protein
MASLDMTAASEALKVLYDGQKLNKLTYQDRPLLAMLNKKTDFVGRSYPLPIQFSNPQGRSATFATAKNNKTPSQYREFLLTRAKDYSLASIDNEVAEASKSDKGAFLSLLENEIDSAFDSIADTLSMDLYGTGSGKRGRFVSTQSVGTSIVTLSEPEDIVNFEVDMALVLSTANGGGAVKSGTMYVISVDRDNGTFVVSDTSGGTAANISTCVATAAASDYIFAAGDYDLKIKGLAAWIPSTTPGATAFFGVDRTSDPTRLAGVRLDISSYTIEEGTQKLLSRMAREGASPDVMFMNHAKYQDYINALGSKVQYVNVKMADVGFEGIKIHGPKSVVTVLADKSCPFDRCYALTSKDWMLASLGRAPKLLDLDGNRVLRDNDADSVEARAGYYAQLGCKAPGRSGVGLL